MVDMILREARALLRGEPQEQEGSREKYWRPENGAKRLSRGAAILLERTVQCLEGAAVLGDF